MLGKRAKEFQMEIEWLVEMKDGTNWSEEGGFFPDFQLVTRSPFYETAVTVLKCNHSEKRAQHTHTQHNTKYTSGLITTRVIYYCARTWQKYVIHSLCRIQKWFNLLGRWWKCHPRGRRGSGHLLFFSFFSSHEEVLFPSCQLPYFPLGHAREPVAEERGREVNDHSDDSRARNVTCTENAHLFFFKKKE